MSHQETASAENIERFYRFTVINQNIITEEQRWEQELSIRANYHVLADGYPVKCGCPVRGGLCCVNKSCFNRAKGIACGPRCMAGCKNNGSQPASREDSNKITELVQGNEAVGLVAMQTISEDERLGEVTGVFQSDGNMVTTQKEKCYNLVLVNHYLDTSQRSSRLSLIRENPSYNCRAVLTVKKLQYKIIIEATRQINAGEELFVEPRNNMDMNYKNQCRRHEQDPPTFDLKIYARDALVQTLAYKHIFPRHYDPSYIEDHVFSLLEQVAAIIEDHSRLKITFGRVTACYQNPAGLYFYEVAQADLGIVLHQVPRHMVFRHFENAGFMLRNGYTEKEKENMEKFMRKRPTRKSSYELKKSVVPSYVERLKNNDRLQVTVSRLCIEGAPAVGLPDMFVAPKIACLNPASNTHLDVDGRKLLIPIRFPENDQEEMKLNKYYECGVDGCMDGCTSVSSTSSSSRDGEEVVKQCTLEALYRRMIEDVVETLAFISLQLCPSERPMSFHDARAVFSEDICHYYLGSPIKRYSKFLVFAHYLLGCEREKPGSVSLNWCSLCKLEKTFKNAVELNEHFHTHHMLCASVYKCHRCSQKFQFPSIFREHIMVCFPDAAASLLRFDVLPHLLDSYAHYISFQSPRNNTLRLTLDGLPSSDPTVDAKHLVGTLESRPQPDFFDTEDVIDGVDTLEDDELEGLYDFGTINQGLQLAMNITTGQPLNAHYVPKPLRLEVQKKHFMLKWDDKPYHKNFTRFYSNLELNKWIAAEEDEEKSGSNSGNCADVYEFSSTENYEYDASDVSSAASSRPCSSKASSSGRSSSKTSRASSNDDN